MGERQNSKTFLITGVSSGLGRAFAAAALDAGHRVIGTVRREEDRTAFAARRPGRAFPLLLDVTDYASIAPAVRDAEAQVGPVEVLINNAGYGHEGSWRSRPWTISSASSRRTSSAPSR